MKMRILIVDDSKTYQDILKKKIKAKFQHIIMTAGTNAEALEIIRAQAAKKQPVHLAFIDYVLTGEDNGIILAKKLRKEFPGLLRIAITDHSDQVMTIIESEMFDHIVKKTFKDEAFDNAIKSAMAILVRREEEEKGG